MPIYEYKGLNSRGKETRGLLDADTPRDLRERLQREGVFLTQYTETGRGGQQRTVGGEKAGSREVRLRGGSIKLGEVSEVTRQLATLLKAGVPVVDALTALSEQLENERFKRVMSQVKRDVSEGNSLADALRAHPTFPPLYVNMVGAGESSGNLDLVFARLADFMDGQVRLRSKLMAAMVYPVIMIFVGTGLVTLMMIVVVPMMKDMFSELGADLPFITQMLIGTSDLIVNYWLSLIQVLALTWALFSRWRMGTGKPTWDRWALKLPIFGRVIRMVAIARFSRTLGTLLNSGVPILAAMDIVKSIIDNRSIAQVIEAARDAVKEGEPVSEPLRRSGEFPSMVTHMIAVGERSGELEEMLGHVAASYEVQVETKVQQLTAVLEPLMILFMGGSVAFMVVAIMWPMMKMNEIIASGTGG
jgi:general secretion pathway protein F